MERRAIARGRDMMPGGDIAAEEQRWLSFSCNCNGGWGGDTCDQAMSAGPDVCGCSLGFGWSKSRSSCQPGGTTSANEAADCAAAGGGTAHQAANIGCTLATLSALSVQSCPVSSLGSLTPASCPLGCAGAILPFYSTCGSDPAFVAELGTPVATAMQLFVAMCQATQAGNSPPPPGGGH